MTERDAQPVIELGSTSRECHCERRRKPKCGNLIKQDNKNINGKRREFRRFLSFDKKWIYCYNNSKEKDYGKGGADGIFAV